MNVATAPELIKAVKTELTPQQVAAGMNVRVRLIVDALGMPQDVAVVSATNDDLAKRTVAAVSQYRFKPATVDHVAVATTISLDINIHQ